MGFIMAKQYKYTVIFEPAEEGGYVVRVPALEGVVTQGDTLEEAEFMAKDAIKGYLETLRKNNLPIPQEDFIQEPVIQKLAVSI
jgi:predicted RNase H-like HicB family nuclease